MITGLVRKGKREEGNGEGRKNRKIIASNKGEDR